MNAAKLLVGKLLISSTFAVSANEISNPRFFEFRSGSWINNLGTLTFGWFKTLSNEQLAAYHQSLMLSVETAENGQKVTWYQDDASGSSTPVYTWPTGSGWCRRIHINVIAHNMEKSFQRTACFDNAHDNWRWMSAK
jgi:surface antigen